MTNESRFRVIEASAGTGKTHWIVERVKNLLIQGDVTLDQIVLLTYTEKAAGELRERIRAELQKTLQEHPEFSHCLEPALDIFDQASIGTIHGFCLKILQEYAFETGYDAGGELVDETSLLESSLRDVQRRCWPKELGNRLAYHLEVEGFNNGTQGDSQWTEVVVKVAGAYRPACGHRLHPDPAGNLLEIFDAVETQIAQCHAAVRKLAPRHTGALDRHPWILGIKTAPVKAQSKDGIETKVIPSIVSWIANDLTKGEALAGFLKLVENSSTFTGFQKEGFLIIEKRLNKGGEPILEKLCPGLLSACQALQNLNLYIEDSSLDKLLTARAIVDIQATSKSLKLRQGLTTFEDMLVHVDEALDIKKNRKANMLLNHLRQRYRRGLVDEFQDTDPLQWAIFKRLFLAPSPDHGLIVVGDPKQAIYGFRGGDLQAYMGATKELKEMFHAPTETLSCNFRSSQDLIDALNCVFDKGHWFPEPGLAYQRVTTPVEEQSQNRILDDPLGRPALSLVKLDGNDRAVKCRRAMAEFIAQEIKRLLKIPLTFMHKGRREELNAGHICVLIGRRKEAASLVRRLRENRIPYSFFKQAGLWQSAEAIHLYYLLRALARPDDSRAYRKALMTRFFGFRPEELAGAEDLNSDHPAQKLFDDWVSLAQEHSWALLFQGILEKSGLLVRDAESPDHERGAANLGHIIRDLSRAAYAGDKDIEDLVNIVKQRRHSPPEDEADYQPLETEKPRVKIMTIHTCKGLEFPVVFLAGGFTAGKHPAFFKYHDGDHVVFDLTCTRKDEYEREQTEEERRLYYVALTRAMFRLYLPYCVGEPGWKAGGAFSKIIYPALVESQVASLGVPKAGVIDPNAAPRIGVKEAGALSNRENNTEEAKTAPRAVKRVLSQDLFPQPVADRDERRVWIKSFSGMHRRSRPLEPPPAEYGDVVDLEREEPQTPPGPDPFRGPAFGEMLHDALEKVDFVSVYKATQPELMPESVQVVVEAMRAKHWAKMIFPGGESRDHAKNCHADLCRLIWNALHTPLEPMGKPLGVVQPSDRLQELEFFFPGHHADLLVGDHFTGFMDLVLRSEGRYYLVDWKSNYLEDGYAPDALARCMADQEYDLQFRLYIHALGRWLRRVNAVGKNQELPIAGVYYLFVRGMNGRDADTGVYFYQPVKADFEGRFQAPA